MAASAVAFTGRAIPAYANTVGRAVHIKIHPRPRNLNESREVLRVLQHYGEVVMYKHLKHEPGLHADNTALAVYQNVEAARKIISASPLRFELGRADASMPTSEYEYSTRHKSVEHDRKKTRSQTPSTIENTHNDFDSQRPSASQSSVPSARQRNSEGIKPKKEFVSAEDGWEAFKGLKGTTTQAPTQETSPANTIPTPKPRVPRPFTSNPTPSAASATDLPYTSSSPRSDGQKTKDEKEKREFHLAITRSTMNHQAYIQRQYYYGGWTLNDKTLMADDLLGRVPVDGFRDCDLGKSETPLRIRNRTKAREEEVKKKSLREIWEEGRARREATIGEVEVEVDP